jgi:hypothetical protein
MCTGGQYIQLPIQIPSIVTLIHVTTLYLEDGVFKFTVTLITVYQSTLRQIQEDHKLNSKVIEEQGAKENLVTQRRK